MRDLEPADDLLVAMEREIWRREPGEPDPALEINVPVASIRTRWPFLYWHRDPFFPWSAHVHLPGRRVLSLRWKVDPRMRQSD